MKVWERISKKFPKNSFKTKKQIQEGMHFHRWLPCDCNDEHRLITDARMNELCSKNKMDCMKCLDEWLDEEVGKGVGAGRE